MASARRRAVARRRGADDLPASTIARLPWYLRALDDIAADGIVTVSSDALAAAAGVSPAQLRKDLSHLGSFGRRGVGYSVDALRSRIADRLGLRRSWQVVVVGAGRLGRALASYGGLAERGFAVAAMFDVDPHVVGTPVHVDRPDGPVVQDAADLEQVLAASVDPWIAVLATPAEAAQPMASRLVRAGVRSILTFAPVPLDVPDGVEVRRVDLAVELQILAFHAVGETTGQSVAAPVGPGRSTTAPGVTELAVVAR
jgi:redox-sensing transcriptional repressor